MYKEFRIGKKEDVEYTLFLLNKADKGVAQYRLEKMEGKKDYFIIVHDSSEFEDCGVVVIRENFVYAISEDVYNFIYRIFSKVLK